MGLANISEPAILLWVNRGYRQAMAGVDLVGVYQIKQWHPAGTTPYTSGRKIDFAKHAGDWEFTGSAASAEITAKHINLQVPRSGGNPVRYVNI